MVVHEDSYTPNERPVTKMSRRGQKKFLVVNNHVREICVTETNASKNIEQNSEDIESKNLNKKLSAKKIKSIPENRDLSSEKPKATEISTSDLEELKTVYTKCKAVIEKIESKYGHLLNIDSVNSQQLKRKSDDDDQCVCEKNKKIVFDDNGQETEVETITSNHICAKKLKLSQEPRNVEINYSETEIKLPETIKELQALLRVPDLETSYRYEVLCKLRTMRQDVSNEIKFNKPSLIEKLKSNPEELLDFKGTNLASLPGYS